MAMQLDSGTGGIRAPAKKPVVSTGWNRSPVMAAAKKPTPTSKNTWTKQMPSKNPVMMEDVAPGMAMGVSRPTPMMTDIGHAGYGSNSQMNMAQREAADFRAQQGNQAAALIAEAARARIDPAPAPTPVYTSTGSGRQRSSGGGAPAPPPSVAPAFVPAESVTAPPAAMQPPSIVANADPSEVNVAGGSFTSMGSPGSFGAYERRRANRGPRTGMSVTPEMIRRAAASRMG